MVEGPFGGPRPLVNCQLFLHTRLKEEQKVNNPERKIIESITNQRTTTQQSDILIQSIPGGGESPDYRLAVIINETPMTTNTITSVENAIINGVDSIDFIQELNFVSVRCGDPREFISGERLRDKIQRAQPEFVGDKL